MAFLAFLKALDFRWWIIGALTIALLASGVALKVKDMSLTSAETETNKVKATLLVEQSNVKSLKAELNDQSKKVQSMSDESKRLQTALDAAGVESKKIEVRTRTVIKYIKQNDVPTDCVGATKHLEGFAKTFGEEWNK